ncbi:MAG: phospho-N-acetylmuramoyl-pentapeptide-transferase [Candidatus Paceibacteria bacterium]
MESFFQIIRFLIVAGASFIVAMMLEPFWYKALIKFKIGKQIRTESAPIFASIHKKKAGTPTMGGVIVWLTVLIITFGFALLSFIFDRFWISLSFLNRAQTYLPLGAFVFAALIGAVDDLLGVLKIGPAGGGLRVRDKIVLYFLVSSVAAWWFLAKLNWDILHVPFFGNYHIGIWAFAIFVILVISATAFSMNETDGLDGLAGGVSLVALAALTVVAITQGKFDLAMLTGSIIGALIAFLWFNIYPARFFMGDTGSMALGVVIGIIALLTNTALLLPFFGFILVFESLSVIAQTVSKKFFKTKLFLSTPVHHHFEARGWPESQVTMRFWILSGVMASLGLIIYFLDKLVFI